MNTCADRYAVFGNPISHSKSPLLHEAFAKQTQQNISYVTQCVDIDGFTVAADHFFNHGGKGLNITVPFKMDAFNYAHQLTDRAKKAGAVNTLYPKEGKIIGDNTDGIGLVNDIRHNLQWNLRGKRILILGAGGAVRGILEPLLNEKPHSIVVANRTVEKANTLADIFSTLGNITGCGFDELNTTFDVIINGTSASLKGALPPLNYSILDDQGACYDLMYAKSATAFMQWAVEAGASHVADGLGMLVCQGAESFYLWRDVHPETHSIITSLRTSL